MLKSILLCLFFLFFFCQCKNDCVDVYDPVCGSDGKNYRNACQANTLRVRYTQGICTFTTKAKILDFSDIEGYNCGWFFEINPLDTIKNAYFAMYNLPDEYKEHELMVEITYTSISDGVGLCVLNGTEFAIIYMNVVDLKKI